MAPLRITPHLLGNVAITLCGRFYSVGGWRCDGRLPIDPRKNRRGHEGGDNRHDHHHGKEQGGDNPPFQADVEDDQLHQATGIHQRANRQRAAVVLSAQSRRCPTSHPLA